MAKTVFIDGEAGTTGLQIYERLAGRQDIELIRLDETSRKDPGARRDALQAADVAILCLPDTAAREAVELVGKAPTSIIDASTAHRVDPAWTYGFPEMTAGQAEKVTEARFVSNPGCYPTGAIALLRPLREAGLLPQDFPISINAVSGYTGGGKALIKAFENEAAPAGFAYGTGQTHKHLPEMKLYSLLEAEPIFVPSVGRFAQGMIVQVPLHLNQLNGNPTLASVQEVLSAHFEGADFVQVAPLQSEQGRVNPEAMNGTNALELHVLGHEQKGQAILTAVLDNLGKGASGAAVQNLNLMLGLSPDAGLEKAA